MRSYLARLQVRVWRENGVVGSTYDLPDGLPEEDMRAVADVLRAAADDAERLVRLSRDLADIGGAAPTRARSDRARSRFRT